MPIDQTHNEQRQCSEKVFQVMENTHARSRTVPSETHRVREREGRKSYSCPSECCRPIMRFSSTSCRTRSMRCSRCRCANSLRADASRARMSACWRDLMATRLRARSISPSVWISSASSASICSSVGVVGRSAAGSAFTVTAAAADE